MTCARLTLLYLSCLLIKISFDVELNPGPRPAKYPCQVCHRAVTWGQRGVACDDCEGWYHVDCMCMPNEVYGVLHNVSWQCVRCGMPNFSSSLFESTTIESTNMYDSLCTSEQSSVSSPGRPIASSSPVASGRKSKLKPLAPLKIININFQSAKNKKEEIGNLIDSSAPDIILGTETWLSPGINSSELFPPKLLCN